MPRYTAAACRPSLTDIDQDSIALWLNRRARCHEIRDCRSADGAWAYTRYEDTGTTWTITHLPTGRQLPCVPSLPVARRWTADGWALLELDRIEREDAMPMCTWRGQYTSAICLRRTDGGERCDRHPTVAAAR